MPQEMKSEDRCTTNGMDKARKLFSRTVDRSLYHAKATLQDTTVGQCWVKGKRSIIKSVPYWLLNSKPRQPSSRDLLGYPD